MSLRNISVRARNLLGFGLLGLILLVTGGVALKEIQGLKHEVLEMRDEWMLGLDWVAQMKSDRQNIRLKESLVLTLPDQVDSLAGSREIVVKSLGPQFASVHGISGATILGDGRVVVILDLLATIRVLHAHLQSQLMPRLASRQAAVNEDVEIDRPTLVMVVDDSVTVRKVTSRLLERNGMNVLTAKDGVDAIAQLQEHKPDIMLLDIEMPRMDGFEVATLVRHDERLKDLPIIMITSRTGEKHRDRAMAIGVNQYLGKPYQESLLLDTIAQLVDSHRVKRT